MLTEFIEYLNASKFRKYLSNVSAKAFCLTATGIFTLVCAGFNAVEFYRGWLLANERWEKREEYIDRNLHSFLIYDRNGYLLGRSNNWIRWNEVSPVFRQLAIEKEDRAFINNPEVISLKGIIRSFSDVILHWRLTGASTIVQQAVKNAFELPPEKNLRRKFAQIILGFRCKGMYSSKQFFEIWANTLYFGGSLRGIEQASQALYGKKAAYLDIVESTELLILLNRPARLFKEREDFENRRRSLLSLWLERGKISIQDYRNALDSVRLDRTYAYNSASFTGVLSSVAKEIKIGSRIPKSFVQTTLNAQMQRSAELAVEQGMKKIDNTLGLQLYTQATFTEKISNYPNASIIVANNDGEIIALCPNRDFQVSSLDRTKSFVEMGSIIKPVIASIAFEQGWQPDDQLIDRPAAFRLDKKRFWRVNNFRRKYVYGNITLAYAVAISSNVAFTSLVSKLGVSNCASRIRSLGLRCPEHLALAIGSGTYNTLNKITETYIPFITLGLQPQLRIVSKIDGNTVSRKKPVQVFSERTAFYTSVLLKNVVLNGTGRVFKQFGSCGAKTGTGHDFSRSLCVVITPHYVIAAMVGYDDSRRMITKSGEGITGAAGAGRIITEFLKISSNEIFEGNFREPSSGDCYTLKSDPFTGEFTPDGQNSIFIPKYFANKAAGDL